ncbi:MAG TPA: hypothetical protein VGC50_11560 [Gammaproteobacteria bacterium]|jgi:hypothetical protein
MSSKDDGKRQFLPRSPAVGRQQHRAARAVAGAKSRKCPEWPNFSLRWHATCKYHRELRDNATRVTFARVCENCIVEDRLRVDYR